jgi:nucleoside transporter
LKPTLPNLERLELAALSFVQMMATGVWMVPLTRILVSNGYSALPAYAYASSAVAAFVSPLVFGAMADRHAAPARVLRWLATASAAAMALSYYAIRAGWPSLAVLGLLQIFALVAVPTSSIANTIIFSRLHNSQKQFGTIRAMGTFGWMCGCWLVSLLGLDASARTGFLGALVWLALAAFTFRLPCVAPPAAAHIKLRERMGWDALVLLKHRDHRVVFLTTALFSIPLAAFYPYAPPHLRQLGFHNTSAWMSLGQVTEILTLLSLAVLAQRWRLKWIFAIGLACGALRFALCALNLPFWLLAGITLHGFSFTLFFIMGQIYLNERVETAWRARAQALMSLMTSGVGSLLGYLGTGLWMQICSPSGMTRWTVFWGWLSAAIACVLIFFLAAYHGRSSGFRRTTDAGVQPLEPSRQD